MITDDETRPFSEDDWRKGFQMAGQRTIGAVRRLRGLCTPGDPQDALLRAIAADVEHLRLSLARGDRVDAMRAHLRRALANAEREPDER